ncbi:hypothetical protein EDD15DRAFT_1662265 [Pisolithus albus]|nr:hypothetical protein EDD15DRAFT_1662265 [Pisolithus albus]
MSQEANGRERRDWERKQQTQKPSFCWLSSLFVSFSSLSLALCSPCSLDSYCMRRIHGLWLSMLILSNLRYTESLSLRGSQIGYGMKWAYHKLVHCIRGGLVNFNQTLSKSIRQFRLHPFLSYLVTTHSSEFSPKHYLQNSGNKLTYRLLREKVSRPFPRGLRECHGNYRWRG